jgi:class 3 adenylate cyclase
MTLRDGTPGQRALCALLVAVPLLGLALALADRLERVGQPNVGWMLDESSISPTRHDTSDAGLRGGGRALQINGVDVTPEWHAGYSSPRVRTEIGATNTLTLRTPRGEVRELTFPVTRWSWHDFIFTQGASDAIGLLFAVVGIASFVLRPYETASWALLSMSCLSGGALLTLFLPFDHAHPWNALYFLSVVGFVPYAPLHAFLAFPVVHPLLQRRTPLFVIYGLGTAQAIVNVAAWLANAADVLVFTRSLASGVLLVAIVLFVGRCLHLALRSDDPLITQRARILLAGALIGLLPFAVVQFGNEVLDLLTIDRRFTIWPLGVFVLAVGRVTVRQELLNARIAVRRAVIYTGAVAVLTAVALLLIAMRPYAVAVMLFPLLYLWPRFHERLNRRLYPQRTRFPELLRGLGNEMAACETADAVLDALVHMPTRLCDARGSVAFLFAGVAGPEERVRGSETARLNGAGPIAAEPLVQLARATRKEIMREQITVQPQYTNIREECTAGFDRLDAVLLLPMLHEQNVIGGLAVGERASGDVYEDAEVDALSTAVQQAVQTLKRIEATDRLREREREFMELNRFFPAQIIEQVMARGGASGLRSERRLVTVVFADLRGFTSFSDSVEPEEVMATLDEYHARMGQRIAEYAGTLERFAGDGFMVFFNDPVAQPDHAERAARMVLAMHTDLDGLRANWRRKGYQIDVGTGIHTGYATCGFVGYEGRREYAVIGNVSNLAARLSAAAAAGEILISARVFGELGERYETERIGELELKGFHQAQVVYRLLAPVAAPAYRAQR